VATILYPVATSDPSALCFFPQRPEMQHRAAVQETSGGASAWAAMQSMLDAQMASLGYLSEWAKGVWPSAIHVQEEGLDARAISWDSLFGLGKSWEQALSGACRASSLQDLLAQTAFSAYLQPLWSLMSGHEDYDDEFLRPSPYATQTATHLLSAAGRIMRDDMPGIIASTLGDGGVRIHFRATAKQLRLAIPSQASGTAYLYHRQGADYGVVHDISLGTLVGWLRWLRADA